MVVEAMNVSVFFFSKHLNFNKIFSICNQVNVIVNDYLPLFCCFNHAAKEQKYHMISYLKRKMNWN